MSIITISETGTIGTVNPSGFRDPAIDGIGIFGPAGASLVGQHFTTVFIGDYCNCTGGIFPGGGIVGIGVNPVQSATLTINGVTYNFRNDFYGEMSPFFQQVDSSDGYLSTNPGGLAMGAGGFSITAHGTSAITSGVLIGETFSNSANVPGPVVGADLSGLLLAMLIIFGGFYWKCRSA